MVEMAEFIFKQAKLEYEIVPVNTNRDYGWRDENGELCIFELPDTFLTPKVRCSACFEIRLAKPISFVVLLSLQ